VLLYLKYQIAVQYFSNIIIQTVSQLVYMLLQFRKDLPSKQNVQK